MLLLLEGKKFLMLKGLSQRDAEHHEEKAFHGLQDLDEPKRVLQR